MTVPGRDYTAGWRDARDCIEPRTVAAPDYRLGYTDALYARSLNRDIDWSKGADVPVNMEDFER